MAVSFQITFMAKDRVFFLSMSKICPDPPELPFATLAATNEADVILRFFTAIAP